MSNLIYLYGFVPAAAPAPPVALAGVADAPAELLRLDGVCAVIGRVPAERYAPEALERGLGDIAWVGEQGVAHERVVLWFVDHTDILPVRLFSLYSGEAALRASLEPRAAGIAAQLRALADRREWNLKVAYDAGQLARHAAEISAGLAALDADIAGAPPGRRYLLERRRTDVMKQELAHAAHRLAGELLEALRPHAEDVRVLPLASSEEQGTVVLNAALLVHRSAEAGLREVAETRMAAQRGVGMLPNLSGPWAPYRFLADDVDPA